MSTQVEETQVSTEKPAIGRDAFAAARAQLSAQSSDQAPAEQQPSTDDTSTETPAEQPEKVADQSQAPTETEDTLLTADELAKLPPKERAQAEKWQATLTKKAQALSAKTKELEQWQPLINGLTSDNPSAVVEELAKRVGLTISKANQDTTVDKQVAAKLSTAIEKLPAELRPLFEPFAEALAADLKASFEGRIKPLAEAQSLMISEAAAAETKAFDEAFAAKHQDYRQLEPKMIELGQKILPTAGVSTDEYMELLYTLAKSGQSKVEQVKETVRQINKSVESSEPRTTGVAEVRVEQGLPANWNQMTSKERMKAAYEAAGRGVIWKK